MDETSNHTPIHVSPKESAESKEKDDFVLSGMFVTFGLLAVVGLLVYLLTVQTHSKKCDPKFGENGEIVNGCNPAAVPTPPGAQVPGQIQFLNNLQQQKVPALDGR